MLLWQILNAKLLSICHKMIICIYNSSTLHITLIIALIFLLKKSDKFDAFTHTHAILQRHLHDTNYPIHQIFIDQSIHELTSITEMRKRDITLIAG